MEFMKSIIFTSCILTVAITIAGNIKSGEKFSRQLSLVFSLVFSAGVLATAIKTGIDFEIPDLTGSVTEDGYTEAESSADMMLKSEIRSRTDCIIEDLLKKNNISFEKVSTDINIEDDGSIVINRVDYKGDDFEAAKRITEENFKGAEVNRVE